jgi:hypothetical protein
MLRISAKMRKRQEKRKVPKKALDKIFTQMKKRRGRPAWVRVNDIIGHAYNNEIIYQQVWEKLWPLLKGARTESDVDGAFGEGAASYYHRTDIWSPASVLELLRDPKLPKTRKAQVKFFAESLAGAGICSPRYARDICAKERAREKRAHHIRRFEVWIECECGRKGLSRDHACPRCGAKVEFPWRPVFPL